MTQPVRVAHFINQFFAGLGGQEASQAGLEVREGPVGPGKALEAALAGQGQVVVTLVCGDGMRQKLHQSRRSCPFAGWPEGSRNR